MRIVHASDLHSKPQRLPKADLYVMSGDFLPNYFYPQANGYRVTPEKERILQPEWIRNQGSWRKYLANRDAIVILCRGNHDFCQLGDLWGGSVYEFTEDPTLVHEIEVNGIVLRVGGVRGINRIIGEWSDELPPADLSDRMLRLPTDIDILVTHSPPGGVLDQCLPGGENLGCSGLTTYLTRMAYAEQCRLKLHCFGHLHEAYGVAWVGPICCSNAATTFQVLDIDFDGEEQKHVAEI